MFISWQARSYVKSVNLLQMYWATCLPDLFLNFYFSFQLKHYIMKGKLKLKGNFLSTIQLRAKQTAHLVNKHYQNEVTLTGQNLPLKCCKPVEILTHFTTGLDFPMLEIWSLSVKGLQSCHPSNFENGSTPVQLESGLIGLTRAGAVWQTFS